MDKTKGLQQTLVRKYMGKRGIHGISIDVQSGTVNVYVVPNEGLTKAVDRIRKDAGPFQVRTIESPLARLA